LMNEVLNGAFALHHKICAKASIALE
jgi:hypothetical protein